MPVQQSEAVTARDGHHHQSGLETILDGCSWQYYLSNVNRVPQVPKPHSLVGTNVHSAIELHELRRMDGDGDTSLGTMIEHALVGIEDTFHDIPTHLLSQKDGVWTQETLNDMATSALTNWYSQPLKDGGAPHREWLMEMTPLAIEPYFSLDLVDNAPPIGGWVDGVYIASDGTVKLVDEKTAGDFSRWKADGSGHRNQATMYAVALVLSSQFPQVQSLEEIQMDYLVSRTRVGKVERARRVQVQPDLTDVFVLGERIRQAESIIQRLDYAPNPNWVLCTPRFCPFYEGCQITGELRTPPQEVLERYRGEENHSG